MKWFREDKEVVTGGSYFIRKDASWSSLELHAVKPADSAKYSCQVSNDAGKVDCTAALLVKGGDLRVCMHVLSRPPPPTPLSLFKLMHNLTLVLTTFNLFS